MKKIILILLMFTSVISFGQKKENGKIYIEHPAIQVVAAFTEAMTAGDTAAMAGMMTDDFKAYNVVSSAAHDKGISKAAFLRNARFWYDNVDYYSITKAPNSYPDAFEYAKDPSDNEAITVSTWDILKGVHKKTGVKVDQYLHRSFSLNKDNKISGLLNYNNPEIGTQVYEASNVRTNGTIYNQHPNINKLRLLMAAAENGDWDKFYSFFDPEATFLNVNDEEMKPHNLEETVAGDKALFEKFDLKEIEMVGYPDYMHYELGDNGVLYSWWNFYFVRKEDQKEIKVPVHYQHDVNAEGKFVNEILYYNGALLK